MKFLFAFTTIIFFSTPVCCQDKISGKVVSDKGEVLSGASVFISNTTVGVTTNATGEFVVNHLPAGNIQLVISFIGYETTTTEIVPSMRSKNYIIQMHPQSNELNDVVVGEYDKRGWKNWGGIFTEAFVGTSAFAKQCTITNTNAIRFVYNNKKNTLYAYANEPLLIKNNSLGYHVTVSLVGFNYNTDTRIIDYQTYALFTEMEGTEDQQLEWKTNREKAYAYSLLHFMRALHNQNLKNEGFQVRRIESTPNIEKQRIRKLYQNKFTQLNDSLKNASAEEAVSDKQIEKYFSKDSVAYYRKVLAEEDKTQNMQFSLESFKDIARATDSNTVLLHFYDYLQVTYIKAKEPEEYLAYKNKRYVDEKIVTKNDLKQMSRGYPVTELSLTQAIPIEIFENGYFTNIDLFMNGFWGWWEKIGTKLPYDYEP